MREDEETSGVEGDASPITIEELQGQSIEIDATNLEVFQSPELMTEALVTIASMIAEETGAEVYAMSGEVSTAKEAPLVDQFGEFKQAFSAALDGRSYEIKMHGTWNVAEHESADEDGEEVQMVTRMTIDVSIDQVKPLG